jgi:hypothetical protein
VRNGGVPYKIMVSATREVCEAVLPGHPQYWANMHYTEDDNILLDRICLIGYWLMLDISC